LRSAYADYQRELRSAVSVEGNTNDIELSRTWACNARMNDKPTNEPSAATKAERLKREVKAAAETPKTLAAEIAELKAGMAALEAKLAALSEDEIAALKAKPQAGPEKPKGVPERLGAALDELGYPLKPEYEGRRGEALREIVYELDYFMDFNRNYVATWKEPARIRAWLSGGEQQKAAEKLASEFDDRPRLMSLSALQHEFAARNLPPAAEFARQIREAATVMRVAAERAQEEHEASARMMQELRRQSKGKTSKKWPAPPKRKLQRRMRLATVTLRIAEKYLDIPTGLNQEPDCRGKKTGLKTGPIVELGKALADICGVPPPSAAVFAKAKQRMKKPEA
jgi:hypothetical protein